MKLTRCGETSFAKHDHANTIGNLFRRVRHIPTRVTASINDRRRVGMRSVPSNILNGIDRPDCPGMWIEDGRDEDVPGLDDGQGIHCHPEQGDAERKKELREKRELHDYGGIRVSLQIFIADLQLLYVRGSCTRRGKSPVPASRV